MTTPTDEIERIRGVYRSMYQTCASDRRYTWHPRNPVAIYYRQARERALIALLNEQDLALEELQVLDIGCGIGEFLRFLASLGAWPENLHGLDLMPERIERARALSPAAMDLRVGDAQSLPFAAGTMDLVSQITVFSSILAADVRRHVAAAALRVLKPGGYFLWYDRRFGNSPTTRGIELDEVCQLFPGCTVRSLRRLHSPLASRLARRSLLLCELADRIPGLGKTHYLILLRKD